MNVDKRQAEFGWTVDLAPTRDALLATAKEARDEAIGRAAEAAGADGWMEQALATIRAVAANKAEFSADDVWSLGLEIPRESRALGAAFMILKRAGEIEPTPTFRLTTRSSRHAAPIRVWRSLVVKTG